MYSPFTAPASLRSERLMRRRGSSSAIRNAPLGRLLEALLILFDATDAAGERKRMNSPTDGCSSCIDPRDWRREEAEMERPGLMPDGALLSAATLPRTDSLAHADVSALAEGAAAFAVPSDGAGERRESCGSSASNERSSEASGMRSAQLQRLPGGGGEAAASAVGEEEESDEAERAGEGSSPRSVHSRKARILLAGMDMSLYPASDLFCRLASSCRRSRRSAVAVPCLSIVVITMPMPLRSRRPSSFLEGEGDLSFSSLELLRSLHRLDRRRNCTRPRFSRGCPSSARQLGLHHRGFPLASGELLLLVLSKSGEELRRATAGRLSVWATTRAAWDVHHLAGDRRGAA
mmetsp:Transcript_30493/g.69893  ORF Transcript_30493/g.69893 Transcript_30493/m.69893 type:complete len:348 (+) Transcript_30493:1439-2482(+)